MYIYLSLFLLMSSFLALMSSYDYIVETIEPWGRRQLLYLFGNFLVIMQLWVWVVLGCSLHKLHMVG